VRRVTGADKVLTPFPIDKSRALGQIWVLGLLTPADGRSPSAVALASLLIARSFFHTFYNAYSLPRLSVLSVLWYCDCENKCVLPRTPPVHGKVLPMSHRGTESVYPLEWGGVVPERAHQSRVTSMTLI
jgi:hypothetical protein